MTGEVQACAASPQVATRDRTGGHGDQQARSPVVDVHSVAALGNPKGDERDDNGEYPERYVHSQHPTPRERVGEPAAQAGPTTEENANTTPMEGEGTSPLIGGTRSATIAWARIISRT